MKEVAMANKKIKKEERYKETDIEKGMNRRLEYK